MFGMGCAAMLTGKLLLEAGVRCKSVPRKRPWGPQTEVATMRKASKSWQAKWAAARATHESGQALIFAAVGMFAFVACAGLAVDMGYLRYQKRLQQSAADSAALAGASAAGTGGNVSQSALDDSKLNGFENGVVLPGATTAVNVAVNGPMTFQG